MQRGRVATALPAQALPRPECPRVKSQPHAGPTGTRSALEAWEHGARSTVPDDAGTTGNPLAPGADSLDDMSPNGPEQLSKPNQTEAVDFLRIF